MPTSASLPFTRKESRIRVRQAGYPDRRFGQLGGRSNRFAVSFGASTELGRRKPLSPPPALPDAGRRGGLRANSDAIRNVLRASRRRFEMPASISEIQGDALSGAAQHHRIPSAVALYSLRHCRSAFMNWILRTRCGDSGSIACRHRGRRRFLPAPFGRIVAIRNLVTSSIGMANLSLRKVRPGSSFGGNPPIRPRIFKKRAVFDAVNATF